jgi:Helix-turn-helix domain
MSNVMLNRVWRLRIPLRLSERMVLLALADRCNGAGICWPGLADLAARSGLRPRAIRITLRRLERRKLLVTHLRRGRTSRYHLLSPGDAASSVNTPAREDRGVGQPSAVNTPAPWCPYPGTAVPPNPQEPKDYTHEVETLRIRKGAGGRKIAARRRCRPRADAGGPEGSA